MCLGPEDVNMKENISVNPHGSGNMPPFFTPSQSVTMATKPLQQAPCQVFNKCVFHTNNNDFCRFLGKPKTDEKANNYRLGLRLVD